jgi:NAD(P)-dependent dehydrogenase (short-subunit alcohol dehydrogenase family)
MTPLNSASCVVTGGASGLGAATVRRLVAAGAQVVIADRDEDRGAALAGELGDRAHFAHADVTDANSLYSVIDRAVELAPLRVAVSCAGVGFAARTLNRDGVPHDLQLFKTVIEVNLVGTFNVIRLAAAAMAKNDPDPETGERGVVINTASVAAFEGQIGQIAYAASKSGVAGMTLPAARDLAPAGIRVVTIAPGVFDTQMLAMLPDEAKSALGASVVFPKRLGDPDEYAALVAHAVDNHYLNGEVIRLDGALRMGPR